MVLGSKIAGNNVNAQLERTGHFVSKIQNEEAVLTATEMRYVIAMVFAIIVAVYTAAQFATPLTTSIIDSMKFESPDQVEDIHSALMIGIALLGLIAGWLFGWAVGGLFVRSDAPKPEDAPKV